MLPPRLIFPGLCSILKKGIPQRGERAFFVKKLFCILLALLTLCLAAGYAAPASYAEEDDGGWLVITKSPSGETVSEGDDAMFISRARNYAGLVWLIISPDGTTVYENNEAEDIFPGLEMSGFEGEELTLASIPFSMDGWYVQTRFLNESGEAFLTERAQISVVQGVVRFFRRIVHSGANGSLYLDVPALLFLIILLSAILIVVIFIISYIQYLNRRRRRRRRKKTVRRVSE